MSSRNNIWAYSKVSHVSVLQGYSDTVRLDDAVYGELASFYALRTPCAGLSLQSLTFSDYGWVGDIRRNGLDSLLESKKTTRGGTFTFPRNASSMSSSSSNTRYLGQLFSSASLEDGPLNDWLVERGVARPTPGDNRWLRLFRHVRNCLVHGRFVCLPAGYDSGSVLVMEDADGSSYTARMVLRVETLLAWKKTIEAGPEQALP